MVSDSATVSSASATVLSTRIFIVVFSLGGLLFIALVTGAMLLGQSIHRLQYLQFDFNLDVTLTDLSTARTWTLPINLLTIPAGVTWSPGGEVFVMVTFEGNRYRYELFEMATSDLRTVVSGLTRGAPPAWSSDGTQIAYIGAVENLCILLIDVPDAELTPRCVDVRPEVPPAWSPDGHHLAVVVQERDTLHPTQLLILTSDGQQESAHPLTFHEISGLEWSPNGQHIAISAADERTASASYETRLEQVRNNWAVYTFDLRSEDVTQRSDAGLYIYDLVWSPDGSRLAFAMDYQRNRDIYIADIGENPHTRRITSAPNEESSLSWSSDGRWLAFSSQEDTSVRGYLIEVENTNPSPVSVDVGNVFYVLWRP